MFTQLRRSISVPGLVLVLGLGLAADARGQADPLSYMFNTGQTIQPIYEGWTHNPDGSFELHFGYLNRNYVDPTYVPVGPDNQILPGEPDRGQPTHFYAREHHRMFSVTVPADFGDRELIWQVTVNGEAYRAVGWLQAEWEIAAGSPFANRFGSSEDLAANQPPSLAVEAARTIGVGDTLRMTARVSDDGLPPERERRGGGAPTLPTFEPNPDGPTLPVNVPQIQQENRSQPTRTRVDRVNVTWTLYRGPIGVTVRPEGEPGNGVATVTARFSTPGEYHFRIEASDGPASVTEEVVVTVR